MRCMGTCSTLHMHTQRAAIIIATRCVFGVKIAPFSEVTASSGFRGHSKRDSNPARPLRHLSSEG